MYEREMEAAWKIQREVIGVEGICQLGLTRSRVLSEVYVCSSLRSANCRLSNYILTISFSIGVVKATG